MTQRDPQRGSQTERRELEQRADAARTKLERDIDVLEQRGRRATRTTRRIRRGARSVVAAVIAFALVAGALLVARAYVSRARWPRRFRISKRARRLLPFIA